eukprot:CAMPEP_0182474830 /NCGR_PEP_ID=MMETSP1319-20130603/26359_1 /TAXON_ID=172717 /ORGANISM="Bolidomonas pacifica, Strain RCC208" /LENGTH=87 /DNA_ID=CAMNT_0024675765 /DNA_START=146 /DNA_END=405 /DNA_ORIENTATION=-
MMAARGNAANKIKAEKKKAEEKSREKRESKLGADGFGLNGISEEELAKLNTPPNKWLDPKYGRNPMSRGWMRISTKIREFAYGERFG